MKTFPYLVSVVLVVFMWSFPAFADSYRRTTADLYGDSYGAAMRRQMESRLPDMRAESYRAQYTVCDEHHNCTDLTATAGKPAAEAGKTGRGVEAPAVQPFLHAPMFQ